MYDAALMTAHRILAMICGQPPEAIEVAHGDYLGWFEEAMGPRVSLTPWDVRNRVNEPTIGDFAGMVITGAPSSLTKPESWMEHAIELIRQAAETGMPVLGVCFGHQLIGCAFGAPTTPVPGEGEHGTHSISLNESGKNDPLFAGMSDSFLAHLTHYDEVDPTAVSYSNGLRVLAQSSECAVQALAAGDNIRSVQYHPEFSTTLMQRYLDEHDTGKAALECGEASLVFKNWIDHWIVNKAS
ncbi:MAG: type 1 glutamine amidotransferase [Myxococcales bacterium]|nr:type 1 glutamine amidotransferase [Myxococcales bacterium]